MFSPAQYLNWAITVVIAATAALRLWRTGGIARLVGIYLRLQVIYAVLLIPASFVTTKSSFYSAFVAVTIVDCSFQMAMVWQLACALRGPGDSFGRLRYWACGVFGLTCVISAISLIRGPEHLNSLEAIWLQVGQIISIARTLSIVTVALYGWIVSSSWPRPALLCWMGLAVQAGFDFASERLDLMLHFSRHSFLQYMPSVGFAIAAALWWFMDATRIIISPGLSEEYQ